MLPRACSIAEPARLPTHRPHIDRLGLVFAKALVLVVVAMVPFDVEAELGDMVVDGHLAAAAVVHLAQAARPLTLLPHILYPSIIHLIAIFQALVILAMILLDVLALDQ